MTKNIKTKTFEFVEKTQISKKGKEIYWYTQELNEQSAYNNKTIVSESLSFNKIEAENMLPYSISGDHRI